MLKDLITDFLEYCEVEKGHSQLTIRNYDHYLSRFLEFAGNIPPEKINLELIRKYRLHLNRLVDNKGKPLKKVTQNYYIIALRSFLKYLAKRDIKSIAPEKLELADTASRSLVFLEIDEIERLLTAPNQEKDNILKARDKAILETLFSTGLRVSELISLNRDKVNLERGEFSVRGKGDKIRVVFLSESAKKFIADYLALRTDNFKPLFIRHQKTKKKIEDLSGENLRLTPRTIQRLIKKYSTIAGLVKKVTPHTIRHSFATDLLISGADIRSVQSMLGHSSITTTQIYTHVTDQQLREVHKAFHGKRRGK
jgi:site-specific recombinase XerD